MPTPRAILVLSMAVAFSAVVPVEVQAQTAVVTGTVHDSIRHEPLADAAVFLWDTPYRAVSDAEGRFRIDDVPPGDYDILFFHQLLGEVGASAGPRSVSLQAGDVATVDLATPSIFTLVTSECLMEERLEGTGIIAGWVGDGESGMGLPGVRVTLSWNVTSSANPERLELRTGSDGWYRACDAPAGTPITAAARFLDRQGLRREVSVPEGGMVDAGFLLFELDPTRVAGYLVDAASSEPVAGAEVWLRGTSIRGITNARGAFEFRDVPPGTYMLVSDHLAYGTKMDTLEIPPGQRISVRMKLDTRAIEIAPLTVTVEAVPIPDLARGGIRISTVDVERVRQRSRDAADILQAQSIAGVIIRRRSDGTLCVGYAPGQVRMMFNRGCVPMVVFINDVRTTNVDMALLLPPDAVDRMVIYKPVEAGNLFGLGAGNGVLVIYTKGN